MRHRVGGFKLKRDQGARKALLRGLVTSVILEERIITTIPKAKAVKPLVDRMITLAKQDTLHSRRQAAAFAFGEFGETGAQARIHDTVLGDQPLELCLHRRGKRIVGSALIGELGMAA